ncbi:ATP synthase subunit C [Noviherbaspirillum sedimenti]|uniref:H+transporting two-sector ATPase C subunit n=1 Tax=Noviherbaspirillum sedimenti TaxID=2320865 RepID=A0A3A3FW18_9BURK|nr:ATP synthase subunit C [Noviherbaspirillum sedimenti]RJG00388.1 H+transporting two-sector ATPase C subunit [Noviherbaspirillum sedimenti]
MNMRRFGLALWLAIAAAGAASLLLILSPGSAAAAQPPLAEGLINTWGLVAAALATAVSSLSAGFAVAKVGTAAIAALAEKPELFGRLLIFVGLAEGIAIYGLIVSILILNRL